MSEYDPNALPFWEIQRGDGPYTRLLGRRKKDTLSSRPFAEAFASRSKIFPQGCSWVSHRRTIEESLVGRRS